MPSEQEYVAPWRRPEYLGETPPSAGPNTLQGMAEQVVMADLPAPPPEARPLNASLREAQVIAPVADLLHIYQQGPGVYLCTRCQLPKDAAVLRAEMDVIGGELHTVIGTVEEGSLWRTQAGSQPQPIPFRPRRTFQRAGEISTESLQALLREDGVGEELFALYRRLDELFEQSTRAAFEEGEEEDVLDALPEEPWIQLARKYGLGSYWEQAYAELEARYDRLLEDAN